MLRKKIEKKLGPPRCVSYERKVWKTGQKISLSLITYHDPEWPATLSRLSCNYTKSMFLSFNQGAEISVSKRENESARVKFTPKFLKNGKDRLQRGIRSIDRYW